MMITKKFTPALIAACFILLLSACQPPEKEVVTTAPAPEIVSPPIPGLTPGGKCARPDELKALNSRALQTKLTLAALTCGERKRYTSFVKQYKSQLNAQAKILRKYFIRNYKKEGNFRLDQFVTQLANTYGNSTRARQSNQFCVDTRKLFIEALQTPTPKLTKLSDKAEFKTMHAITACK